MSLKSRIVALIEAQGPVSVAQFMTIAMLDPQQGYYATRDPLGAGGDFTTAPEISQMFGEMIGLWLVQAWADQGSPKNPRLVELGPGRGTLMADILRVAQVAPDFTADLEVVMVEASPALQEIQAEKLRGLGADTSWQAQFDDSLADRPLFLAANEFFDALPLRQYVKTERGWCERMVTALNGELTFALAPVPVPSSTIPADRAGAPDGGVYENSPAATALAEDIARIITAKGGAALMIDYGYGEAAGFSETLQAVSGHKFAEALAEPGETHLCPCGLRRFGPGRTARRRIGVRTGDARDVPGQSGHHRACRAADQGQSHRRPRPDCSHRTTDRQRSDGPAVQDTRLRTAIDQ